MKVACSVSPKIECIYMNLHGARSDPSNAKKRNLKDSLRTPNARICSHHHHPKHRSKIKILDRTKQETSSIMAPVGAYILMVLAACILFSVFALGLLHILATMARKAGRIKEKDFQATMAGGARIMTSPHECNCQHGFRTETACYDDGRCRIRYGWTPLTECG